MPQASRIIRIFVSNTFRYLLIKRLCRPLFNFIPLISGEVAVMLYVVPFRVIDNGLKLNHLRNYNLWISEPVFAWTTNKELLIELGR